MTEEYCGGGKFTSEQPGDTSAGAGDQRHPVKVQNLPQGLTSSQHLEMLPACDRSVFNYVRTRMVLSALNDQMKPGLMASTHEPFRGKAFPTGMTFLLLLPGNLL